jgi:putative endonuclease
VISRIASALEKGRARVALGRHAEDVVADWLFVAGYTVMDRNVRFGARELDLVATKGSLVAIVEVRTRGAGAWAKPFASITPTKRRHLLIAAGRLQRQLARSHPALERFRIDVAAVAFEGGATTVSYVPGAIVRRPEDRLS